jgi:transcriptional regulator with XRE-family HTH domain
VIKTGEFTVADANGAGEPASAEPPFPQTATVGARLRAAREVKGLSLDQVREATRISARHLAALETGDYGAMPGRTYAVGFARNYARAVGLDEHDVAEAIQGELGRSAAAEPARPITQYELGDPIKAPSRRLVWLSLLAVALLVAGGFAFRSSFLRPAAELPALAGPSPAPKPRPVVASAPAAARPATAAAAPANGAVLFTALEDKIWVKFYDGAGKQLMQKQMARGETYTVPADAKDPKVWTGRPDAFALTIGGKPVPKLADKQVTMKDVAVSAAALLARAPVATPSAVPGAAPVSGAPAPGPR